MALTVPRPVLRQEGATGPALAAEKPITLACGPVTFPDGTPLTPTNVVAGGFGFRLYRERAGGLRDAWDEATKRWVAASAAPAPQSLYPDEPSGEWRSTLVAIGQKDDAGNPKFAAPALGLPRYEVECFFKGKDAAAQEHAGASPRSQAVTIFGPGQRDRAGLAINPEELPQATEIRLFLKDAALLAEQGVVAIRQVAGGIEVDLALANGARVRLEPTGDVLVRPATGRSLRIEGDVDVAGVIRVFGVPLLVP